MTGIERIAAERQRQIDAEGFTPERDAEHANGELARAGAAYAAHASGCPGEAFVLWPFEESWWKPGDRVRALEKAGALIAAEIDRLTGSTPGPSPLEAENARLRVALEGLLAAHVALVRESEAVLASDPSGYDPAEDSAEIAEARAALGREKREERP